MAFIFEFTHEPAPWLPLRDMEAVDKAILTDLHDAQGKAFENPAFNVEVVWDVHNIFVTDLFHRIRMSDRKDQKLVVILPSPENPVFISLTEVLNKYRVSCRNVHVFFLYEYANEKGDVAPWNSPYSRSGHFMRYFYNKLDARLRMPMEQIHFWTKENAESYSDLIAAEGGADVAYTTMSWSGGIGAIDAETYPAKSMEELLQMGSRYVTPMPENIAMDSQRGMFGFSGDLGNVPPCAVTVGPKDLAAAKTCMHMQYLTACGGTIALQKSALKLSLFGPLCPENTGSLMRLLPGTCYMSEEVATDGTYRPDAKWLEEKIESIRKQEEGK